MQVLMARGLAGDREEEGLYLRCLFRMAADPHPDWYDKLTLID